MKIPIDQFEQYIDETILKRGHTYFKNGYVQSLEELSNDTFEAIVLGTENYRVTFIIKERYFLNANCSCPYDYGAVCKHMVAVFLCFLQDELGLAKPTEKKPRKKRKTIGDKISEILSELSTEDLKYFVKKHTEENKSFRDIFLARFAHTNQKPDKKIYHTQVKRLLSAAKGTLSYLDYNGAREASSLINELLQTGTSLLEKEDYTQAFYLAAAVFEEMIKALDYADDSNGDIGYCIDQAEELLWHICKLEEVPETLRAQLFTYFLDTYNKKLFKGWDWHLGLLEMAVSIAKKTTEIEKVKSLLQAIKKEEYDYEYRSAQKMIHTLLIKEDGKQKAKEFLLDNLENTEFRALAIEEAIKKKDFTQAIIWAEEGAKNDAKSKPGLVPKWEQYLYRIYETNKNSKKVVYYAKKLFINNFQNERDYFKELKIWVPKEDWEDFVEKLLKDLVNERGYVKRDLLIKIFIAEKMWPRLLHFVKNNVGIEQLHYYEKYLLEDYRNKIIDIYYKGVIDYLHHNIGRKYYKRAAKYIKHIRILGDPEKSTELINILTKKYNNRPALLEEFSQL